MFWRWARRIVLRAAMCHRGAARTSRPSGLTQERAGGVCGWWGGRAVGGRDSGGWCVCHLGCGGKTLRVHTLEHDACGEPSIVLAEVMKEVVCVSLALRRIEVHLTRVNDAHQTSEPRRATM